MKLSDRYISDKVVASIFEEEGNRHRIKVFAKFKQSIFPEISWTVDRSCIFFKLSEDFNAIGESLMRRLATRMIDFVLSGDPIKNDMLFTAVKNKLLESSESFMARIKAFDDDFYKDLAINANRLVSNGLNFLLIENIEIVWTRIPNVIGLNSKLYNVVCISSQLDDLATPDYVLDYVLCCNVLEINGKDPYKAKLYCPEYEKAIKYLKEKFKNIRKISTPNL